MKVCIQTATGLRSIVRIVLFALTTLTPVSKASEAQPPVFTCHAGASNECAYRIHVGYGSINVFLSKSPVTVVV